MLLITGATGHSGSHLINMLAQLGYNEPIRCLVRENSDLANLKASNLQIDYRFGDLDDFSFVDKSMEGVKVVIHLASIIYSENITRATLNNKVEWVIYVHTTGRYSKYKSAAQDYISIEEQVIKSGQNYTILRPTMIYGSSKDRNMYKLIDYLYRHKFFPVFGNGCNLMQPIHARDVAQAVFKAFLCREKVQGMCYNIAGKEPVKYIELLRIVSRKLKRKNIFIKVPYWLSYTAACVYNALFKSAVISVEQVMRMNEDKAFDYSEASRDFGFDPVSYEEGIKEEIDEYLRKQI